MNRYLAIALVSIAAFGCTAIKDYRNGGNNGYENPFYAKYLNTGSSLDAQITSTLEALRQNPNSPALHNELGSLLVQKGFPKDAEREFERAVNLDGNYYPAWYNLGLVRASAGDDSGARRAFYKTIAEKPGHAIALFQLGLIEEKRKNTDKAVALYAKAYTINQALLDVDVNPRVLDSHLTHLAMIKMYEKTQARRSMQFQGRPADYTEAEPKPEAASPEARPQDIVTPAPPATDPAAQPKKKQ